MLAARGIKMYGEQALAAIMKELKQLNDGAMNGKPAVLPIDPKTLTAEEKEHAMEAVALIKKKNNGTIKGRCCANRAKRFY
jgi:hypothetical protein